MLLENGIALYFLSWKYPYKKITNLGNEGQMIISKIYNYSNFDSTPQICEKYEET